MKHTRIYILFFSIAMSLAFAQSQLPKDKDTIVKKNNWRYTPNFLVGFNILEAGLSFGSEQKFQGYISSEIKENTNLIAEGGYAKNNYKKNSYDASAKGIFLKLGAFYMLSTDSENKKNGFYVGGKIGGSSYTQEYFSLPVKGAEGQVFGVAFPASRQSSYWVEAMIGGRVQLFKSDFFIDVNVQPRYLIYTTKQDKIFPMIVPGFGKSSTKFGFGYSWNLSYYF
ncbi:DUF6048 family protein [Riemerella columbipharyngis]|uniref:Outer membrane protein beta-barrel domain-containing protein n=1 Tax=Riemerella columbipharyngis TaxID=1071918 RepID=A0A1G6Z8R3_9FLAO|nr:DUF6048 family protein [Riemerella columbipharyngis]SDD99028.1 hypothetical protein SAMN05421544_1025 [Riemerella columbipharyngis]